MHKKRNKTENGLISLEFSRTTSLLYYLLKISHFISICSPISFIDSELANPSKKYLPSVIVTGFTLYILCAKK
jgi:hypothetical protein